MSRRGARKAKRLRKSRRRRHSPARANDAGADTCRARTRKAAKVPINNATAPARMWTAKNPGTSLFACSTFAGKPSPQVTAMMAALIRRVSPNPAAANGITHQNSISAGRLVDSWTSARGSPKPKTTWRHQVLSHAVPMRRSNCMTTQPLANVEHRTRPVRERPIKTFADWGWQGAFAVALAKVCCRVLQKAPLYGRSIDSHGFRWWPIG